MPSKDTPGQTSGPATDRHNEPVVDPTRNVEALVAASQRRLDDLRAADALHARDLRELTEKWTERLRVAEKERIDSAAALSALNGQRATEVQAAAALALAAQVSTSAEALRASQAAAAALADTKLVTSLEPIQKRIDDLSRAQSEAVGGKQQTSEIRDETRSSSSNLGMWVGVGVAVMAIVGSTVLTVTGFVVTVMVATGVFGGP